MSKISTYEVVPVPKLADKLIGTSVGGEIEDITYNFTLMELLDLFIPNLPSSSLQSVLDSGNTATQDINLFGTITTTNLDVTGTTSFLDAYFTGEVHITGGLYDAGDSIGTPGQVLTSTGDTVEWVTLPPIFTPNLQQVLTEGNTADIDIALDANLEALDVTADSAHINNNITISGTITDGSESVGSNTQVLSSTGSGVQWTNLPAYTALNPLHFNPSTGQFSIQVANASQGGYLSSADWITFDGKQNAGNYITALTGEATASGPGSASVILNNASVINKVLTGLNIAGGSISASDSILTAFGKIQNQINGLVGGVQYQGTWDASTNDPYLQSSVGIQGHFYIVSVAGNTDLNGITDWKVGDWAIFNNSSWTKVDNTESVTSVNGQIGAVSLTTDNIPEGVINQYFTQARARASLSFVSGSGAYNNLTGVITIPTNTNELTNGAEFITLNSLTATSPLSYSNLTGVFSIQVANAIQNGYLSAADWVTFNSKQSALGGTGLVKSTAGSITYVTDNSSDWNTAYNRSIVSAAVTGTTTKTLTLTEQDGNTITASWTDLDTGLTSVGLSMPSAFSVANSPLTSNGTIAVTGAGTTLQYVRGDGSLATFPTLTGYVPYVGATTNVNLGEYGITSGYFQADLTPSGVLQVGRMQWNPTDGTMDLRLLGNNVTLQIGEENVTRVVNKSGIDLLEENYQVVRARKVAEGGAQGQRIAVVLAQGNTENNSTEVLGLVTETINANQEGFITCFGEVKDIDTTGTLQGETWVDGDILYLSSTVAGGLTNVRPVAPNHSVTVGYVTYAHAIHGKIYMAIDTGYELGELHNVYAPSPANNASIWWNNTTLRYENNTIAGILGYTPANSATTLTINGTTYDLSGNRTWSVGTVTNVSALTIGTAGTDLSSSVASGTTNPVITLNVPTASASNRGALSAADWTLFNSKQEALTFSSPLVNNSGVVSMPAATALANGYLTSTDWSTFNNKQNALSLTTAGSSGSATLVGSTLNVPTYTLSGLGGVPTSRTLTINGTPYDLSADRSWSVGTVTSVTVGTGETGIDVSANVTTPTSTPLITINIPIASAVNTGKLSNTDWATFNSKVSSVTASSPLSSSGGANPNITIQQASGSQNGYLSSTDWSTFNNKQAAGNYITSLTGEATASGPGSAAVTLNNASVTGKVLTGVNITGGTIQPTDSMLTAFGKLQNQINGLVGGSIYQGTWNASTNTPALASGVGTKGYYYIVSVAGTTNLDGITDWFVGDWAIFDGTAWQQVDNTDAVISVNGQTGAVNLTTDNIPEGATNQYFTNTRARAALSFAAGSGAYNSSTGVITIPTNTNQLTNGASFITLASLSGTTPISYNNTTGAISISQSNTSTNGYLSSTDWNTFNNKQAAITLTTTGTSGAATFVGNVLNIPQYTDTYVGTVTSVGLSAPTGFSVSNSPITSSGTIALSFTSGYSLPTTASQANWDTAYSNRITSASAPLSISSNVISISQANSSTSGYLTSTDWNTFNGKQGAITLTTTGSSGVATFSGNVLNIPNYGSALGSYLPLSGGTMTGTIQFSNDIGTAIQGTIGVNDFWRIYASSTGTNAGYLEIATADDGTEPIYVSQYTGVFSSLTRRITLLDGSGNTTFPGSVTSNISDSNFVAQSDGTSGVWRGRILSKNATADVASFLGTYTNVAGVFAHNNALSAWADLYVNTVNGSTGGVVRMPSTVYINTYQAIHAGNYNSYSPTLTGGGASGTWGINVTGYSMQLNGYGNQTIHTILTGPANGPVWKVRYDSATANRYADLGFQDGNGVYTEGLKMYNGSTLTWLGYNVLTENGGTWNINISGNAATATTASNSNALNGWGYTSYAYRSSGSGYYQIDTWIQMNGNFGMYWPSYYGLHLYPNNDGSYGSLQVKGTKNGWSGIHFDTGTTLMMNSNESGHYGQGYGWQYRWANGSMYISTNSYGGGSEGTVWHSLNAPRANYSNLMYYAGFTLDANSMPDNSNGFTYSQNAPYTGPIIKFGDGGYAMQINGTYSSGANIAYRTRNGDAGSWNSWYSFVTSANIGSQSVSYASTAGSAPANGGTATALNSSNYISQTGSTGSWNADFQNTPAGTARYGGDVGANTSNNPGGTWWIQQNFRHTNSGNYWGVQVAWGWEDNPNRLATRSISGGTFGGWVYYLNSANYSSWAVPIGGAVLTSTFQFQSNLGGYCGSLANPPLQAYATGGNSAFFSFHRAGNYAVNMGLDADNVLRIGGWSASANRWQLDMSGNNTLAGYVAATGFFNGPLATNSYGASSPAVSGRVYGPTGAAYSYAGGGITGAIKIRLPFRANDLMWSMKVRIYNYSQQQTSEYTIGNYSYSAGFYNSSASFSGGSSATAQTVRFGNDGSYDCIWIGETSTTWSYPVVSVMDFMGGYANGNVFNYYQNWDVSIVGSFGTVGGSLNPDIKFNNVFAPLYYDSSNTSYYVQPSGASTLNNLRIGGKIRYAAGVDVDSGFGLYFDDGMATSYAIYREAGSWNWPYPDLRIAFHTGISMGANPNYGGIRMFSDYDMSVGVLYINNASYGGAGNVYAFGSIYATAFYETSDARLKTIIENNARVKNIELIKPKLYEKSGKKEFGYIAQDFVDIMPYALSQENVDKYYSLVYREVHTAKIANLEDSVDYLKERILYLENQLKEKQNENN